MCTRSSSRCRAWAVERRASSLSWRRRTTVEGSSAGSSVERLDGYENERRRCLQTKKSSGCASLRGSRGTSAPAADLVHEHRFDHDEVPPAEAVAPVRLAERVRDLVVEEDADERDEVVRPVWVGEVEREERGRVRGGERGEEGRQRGRQGRDLYRKGVRRSFVQSQRARRTRRGSRPPTSTSVTWSRSRSCSRSRLTTSVWPDTDSCRTNRCGCVLCWKARRSAWSARAERAGRHAPREHARALAPP